MFSHVREPFLLCIFFPEVMLPFLAQDYWVAGGAHVWTCQREQQVWESNCEVRQCSASSFCYHNFQFLAICVNLLNFLDLLMLPLRLLL